MSSISDQSRTFSDHTMEELKDEVEAINAIYPDSLTEDSTLLYSLTFPESPVTIRISFPSSYPEEPPNILSLKGSNDENTTLSLLQDILSSVFVPSQVVLFEFIEASREVLESALDGTEPEPAPEPAAAAVSSVDIFAGWVESEVVVDRKSQFIGRAIKVDSAQEALDKISLLKQDRKIARATHNMTAYRIAKENGIMMQDCDDDGETAAGGRLLHLLQLTDSKNVCVCVSRWYGGIHLGPDR